MAKALKGKLITFEGAEGSGKSTQAGLLYGYLVLQKKRVMYLREPGGVRISEAIRRVLLDVKNKEMNDICETLLYMAARSQLVTEVIAPALKRGTIVLCDRFLDSTIVYQGMGCGVDVDFIKHVGKVATRGIKPDLTLLFDIETQKGLFRKGKVKDRIEERSLKYHSKVRRGYLELARQEPHRIKVIPVGKSQNLPAGRHGIDRSKEEIQEDVRRWVNHLVGA